MVEPILRVQDLSVEFIAQDGVVKAVNRVNLSLAPGSTLVITGESGSGKSTIALSILRLLPHAGQVTQGRIIFEGIDMLSLDADELRAVRGRDIAIVFQDPTTGLNPVLTVGQQVEEIIENHLDVGRREAKKQAVETLGRMGLPDPAEVARRYPFQLSGGMAQRVMIGIATALNPKVLILDEPTSALDVTVQASILEDLRTLQHRNGTTILLITHDLGVVAQMANEVAVMYAGSVAEYAPVLSLFEEPRHPYTASLMASRPRMDRDPERLAQIRGAPPSLINLPDQCAFLERCQKATSACRTQPTPTLHQVGAGHYAACYNPMYVAPAEERSA